MSIEAALEINKGEYLPLEDGIGASKPIASFCTGALELYCHFRAQPITSLQIEAVDQELIDWFTTIASHMTTDLCLLSQILWGYWDYADTEYARYVEQTNAYLETQPPEHRTEKLLSEQEFLNICAQDKRTWTDPAQLQQVVNDLVHALQEIHPPETSWYHPDDAPRHFEALAKTLTLAVEKGYAKVRLNCE